MVSMDYAAFERRDRSVRSPDLKLFVRDVRDRQCRKRPITVRSWSTIKDVKDVIQQIIHVPVNAQRLYYGPLLTSGGELPNHRVLHDAGVYRSGETLLLDIKGRSMAQENVSSIFALRSSGVSDICISSSMISSTPKMLRPLVERARRGFNMGLKPEFVMDGSGGTYFLCDARKYRVAVFKPADEEPYAENNPRGYVRQGGQELSLREGVVPGEACIREVAAYLLDHEGLSGVPMTTLAEARHPAFNNNGARLKVSEGGASIGTHKIGPTCKAQDKKVGSFQEYVNAECTIDDISPSMMNVSEVHKIAILDIRIMNADRNSANLLVRRKRDNSLVLVPIDHGFCLRSVCDVSWMDWCWLDWPQLKQPLSEKHKKYINDLDIEADARLLQERLNIASDAIDIFRASSRVLKAGVEAGLTLYDIATICCRNDDLGEIASKLEMLSSMASELALSALENGRWHHAAASRALVEQLSPQGTSLLRSNTPSGSPGMNRKFTSALNLQHTTIFSGGDGASLEDLLNGEVPGAAQSSGSDSGSDHIDVAIEKEECEEWAAALIADVTLDQSRVRSTSIESEESSSDSNLSCSPRGFWQVRPGSPLEDSLDDESVSWSPSFSPRNQVTLTESIIGSPLNSLLLSPVNAGGSGNTNEDTFYSLKPSSPTEGRRLSSVTFFEDPGPSESMNHNMVFPELKKATGIKRSQSYSALSGSTNSTNQKASDRSIPEPFTKEYGLYRDYYLKFVDLVIDREITAATLRLT